jgi:uncharacterized protein with FMN-binding domain
MRRVLLAIAGTLAGLVMLLSFKSHTSPPGGGIAAAPQPQGGGQGGSGSAAPATPAAPAAGNPGGTSSAGTRTVTGNVANTLYGPVQIQLTLRNGKIAKVTVLEQPSGSQRDTEIGNFAFPQLIRETLTRQSAHIDMVSGATYTSQGYLQSLQSALDNGSA